MLKWLQGHGHFSFQQIPATISRCCDHSRSGSREWILILMMRHPILPNTNMPFWSMWRMNTVPNICMCRSINMKAYQAAIISLPQRLQAPVNHPLINLISPALMKNTQHQTMLLKRHLDEAIAQHAYWPLPGSIWLNRRKNQSTGVKLIQISMITTPTK